MRPRLALGPWWTHDQRVARPLRGSGGHRDSSEREREEVIDVFTNDHMTTLNRGGQWYSDVEMISDARKRDWRRGGCGG
jgi:hypothetical protein